MTAKIEFIELPLRDLIKKGIPITKAILFGSHARGDFNKDSDIDVLLISPAFDFQVEIEKNIPLIWLANLRIDNNIEPFPIGSMRFTQDKRSPVLEAARQEGIEINIDSDLSA